MAGPGSITLSQHSVLSSFAQSFLQHIIPDAYPSSYQYYNRPEGLQQQHQEQQQSQQHQQHQQYLDQVQNKESSYSPSSASTLINDPASALLQENGRFVEDPDSLWSPTWIRIFLLWIMLMYLTWRIIVNVWKKLQRLWRSLS